MKWLRKFVVTGKTAETSVNERPGADPEVVGGDNGGDMGTEPQRGKEHSPGGEFAEGGSPSPP